MSSSVASDALAAGFRAVAEGEKIVRDTTAAYGLKPRQRAGPAERAWRQRAPTLAAEPALPDYFLTDAECDHVEAITALFKLARQPTRRGRNRAEFLAIGHHLAKLRHGRDRADFGSILLHEFKLSTRRAQELMAAASGTKSLEKLRADTAARVKKMRQNKARAHVTRAA